MATDSIVTIVLMSVCFVALVAWDIYVAFFNNVPNRLDTESGIMRRLGARIVGVPMAWGALGGHFWGPSWDPPGPYWGHTLALALIAVAASVGHFFLRKGRTLPAWSALIYFVAGVPLGALLWPQ